MKVVNQPVMKKDAMSLVTGKPVFLDDVMPDNALVVKAKKKPLCPCPHRGDQDRHGAEGAGHRGHLYL